VFAQYASIGFEISFGGDTITVWCEHKAPLTLLRGSSSMLLAEQEKVLERCDALTQRRHQCRDDFEKHRDTILKIAQFDQSLAASKEKGLQSITAMADSVVSAGRLLIEELVLRAQVVQLVNELLANSNGSVSDVEKKSINHAAAERLDQGDSSLDVHARLFVSDCARRTELCLDWVYDSILEEDFQSAKSFCEQAQRLNGAMREIQDSWPWLDIQAEQESWTQYQRGELMDFETFKNELLKAAK
jgi:hypothetical protein